jgi:phosphoglucosamine mutase
VVAAARDVEARLAGAGRLLLRPSGTERLIRVMAEGEDEALVHQVVAELCALIEQVSAPAMAGE